MGVMVHAVSPPFLIILQWWLSEAQEVANQNEMLSVKVRT
jgi:hypothetical protein